ncbi:MAG TPA: Yip1 family protein [Acidobacteriaceae bacterium]|nr:Yip1 family protein [Acidobacteriaceae bacterium]
MTDTTATAPIQAPLSETQRCIDVFTSPSKTFTDIGRKATFWGPLIIMIIVGVSYSFSVQTKIGWPQVFENTIHQTPDKEAKINAAPNPEQIKAISAKVTAGFSYGYFVLALIITLVTSLLFWATVNFGFGGTAKYSQIYAVSFYAGLVMNIKYILAIIAVFAGLAPESFLIQNPVGTNIGYYLSTDAPRWLSSLCMHLDIFEIWSLVLTVIGVAIVARVSRGKAAAVVIGWWVLIVLISAGAAAI